MRAASRVTLSAMNRVGRTLIVLGAALAALPAGTAAAGTVAVEGGQIVFRANPGEINRVSVFVNENEGPDYHVITDSTRPTSGSGCEDGFFSGEAVCRVAPGTPIVADLGDGADEATLQLPNGRILGGPGDDVLKGNSSPNQTFDGGPGNDQFDGDSPPYCIEGTTPSGPDVFIGGEGVDTVDYSDSDVGQVNVTLDGAANDGGAGEGDNVNPDVENVDGTTCAVNDITGSAAPNALTGPGILRGLGGDDTLVSNGSSSDLQGGDGNDTLRGQGGNDKLDGGAGDDFVEGGFDDDILTGGPGKDSLVGDETRSNTIGTGNDRIDARDGIKELVSCGPGSDVAVLDADDEIPVDTQNLCETVDRAAAPPGGGGGGGTGAGAFPITFSGSSLKVSKSGRVSVRLTCKVADAAGCNGTLRLASAKKVKIRGRKRTFSLGSKSFSIAPGKSGRVAFKLSSANRSALRRLKKVRLTAKATERAATPRVYSKSLTLRR